MAYGKLAKTSEELSEEKLAEMLKRLNEEGEEQEPSKDEESKEHKC